MKKRTLPLLVAAAALAACGAATAQSLARADYERRVQAIADQYRSAQAACAPLAGHPQDVCLTEAEAEMRIARSALAARYRPSATARHHASVVAADSRDAVARERCANRTGAARTACVAAAKALRASARDKAKAEFGAAEAKAKATERSDEDREEAASKTFAARYAAARRQCDGYARKLKELCLAQTRERFVRQR